MATFFIGYGFQSLWSRSADFTYLICFGSAHTNLIGNRCFIKIKGRSKPLCWRFPPVCLFRPVCLFQPVRLFFYWKIPTCTFIPTCTTISNFRVWEYPLLTSMQTIKCVFCLFVLIFYRKGAGKFKKLAYFANLFPR